MQKNYYKLSQTKSLNKLSKRNTKLNVLFRRAQSIDKLNLLLDGYLLPPLQGNFKISAFKDGSLHLITHSAALATRFRFMQPTLLSKLKQTIEFKKIQSFEIKIRPLTYKQKPKPKPPLSISTSNAELLRQEAALTHDPALSAVLMKIANHANPLK